MYNQYSRQEFPFSINLITHFDQNENLYFGLLFVAAILFIFIFFRSRKRILPASLVGVLIFVSWMPVYGIFFIHQIKDLEYFYALKEVPRKEGIRQLSRSCQMYFGSDTCFLFNIKLSCLYNVPQGGKVYASLHYFTPLITYALSDRYDLVSNHEKAEYILTKGSKTDNGYSFGGNELKTGKFTVLHTEDSFDLIKIEK